MAMAHTKSVPTTRPIKIFEGTLDLAAPGAAGAAIAEVDVTVAGVLATDILLQFGPTDTGLAYALCNARVKAANTISFIPINTDDANADPAGTLNFRAIVIPAI